MIEISDLTAPGGLCEREVVDCKIEVEDEREGRERYEQTVEKRKREK